MKITEENYEEFYFGNACECFIQGEFYELGYEALKTSPDIGYDLLVTNCARTKFLKEEPKQYNVQVKGRVCSENKVIFYIKKEDIKTMLEDKNSVLVCVFCHPNYSDGRENIIVHREYDPVRDSHIFEDYYEQLLNEEEYPSFKKLKEYNISYAGFNKDYIWFNHTHLHRLMDEGYFYEYKDNYCLAFGITENTKYPIDENGERLMAGSLCECSGSYAYEMTKIQFLMDMSTELEEGKMFMGEVYI